MSLSSAHAAHLQFNFADFVTGSITGRTVRISPLSTPTVSGTQIIHHEPINTNTAAGTIYVSNVVAGSYSVLVTTPIKPTTFTITVPDTNILIDASTILSVTSTNANGTAAYSIDAANARFVVRNDGWSSNQIATNFFFKGSTNLFRHTNGTASGNSVGLFLKSDGTNAFWATGGGGSSITVDASQLALTSDNLSIIRGAVLTNPVVEAAGLIPGLTFRAGAGLRMTNGTATFASNSIVNIGTSSDLGSPQLRFGSAGFASDYTGTEEWNFRTAVGGGANGNTVLRKTGDTATNFTLQGSTAIFGFTNNGPANFSGTVTNHGSEVIKDTLLLPSASGGLIVGPGSLTILSGDGTASFANLAADIGLLGEAHFLRNNVFFNDNGIDGGDAAIQFNSDGSFHAASTDFSVDSFGAITAFSITANGGTFHGSINMDSHLISSVTDPVSAQDAATKAYVDAASLSVTNNAFFTNYFATLTTTDNTTNNLWTLSSAANRTYRVVANVVGFDATSSASYGKAATFKNVAGTVTQVGTTATIGGAEDDSAYECLVDVNSNTIRLRVAGNTGRTVNWTATIQVFKAP